MGLELQWGRMRNWTRHETTMQAVVKITITQPVDSKSATTQFYLQFGLEISETTWMWKHGYSEQPDCKLDFIESRALRLFSPAAAPAASELPNTPTQHMQLRNSCSSSAGWSSLEWRWILAGRPSETHPSCYSVTGVLHGNRPNTKISKRATNSLETKRGV